MIVAQSGYVIAVPMDPPENSIFELDSGVGKFPLVYVLLLTYVSGDKFTSLIGWYPLRWKTVHRRIHDTLYENKNFNEFRH